MMRPEVTRSYSTPTVYEPEDEPTELIVPGSYYLTSYSAETGEKLWWVSHMSWQPKSVPVIHNGLLIANSVEPAGAGATGSVVSFAELLAEADRDSDDRVSEAELKVARPRMRFETTDLDSDGQLDVRDWEFYVARRTARNRMVAVRLGGRGDLTDSDRVVWSLERFLPNVPSPLIYEGILYLVKDGGILSSLDPETGEIFKQGRLGDAIDTYYASPVAADGKVYLISVSGQATALQAGAQWEILSSSNFEDAANATPAIRDGRIYLRTKSALYCFAEE
jgi:outer membrane protein assembly factor BamB